MDKVRLMEVGASVMLINIIVKSGTSITITSKSRVCKTGPVNVSADLERSAMEIAVQPTSPESPLLDVEKSPVKSMMTVRGQVVAEEMTRTVIVRGRDVKVKAVVLKDHSGKCKVSLWREFSTSPISVGQHVKITDVVVQSYNNEKSLSTTTRTQIEPIDNPREVDVVRTIIAFSVGESSLLLVVDDGELYPSYRIANSLMEEYLGCLNDEVEEQLTSSLPLKAILTIENEEIIDIQ